MKNKVLIITGFLIFAFGVLHSLFKKPTQRVYLKSLTLCNLFGKKMVGKGCFVSATKINNDTQITRNGL